MLPESKPRKKKNSSKVNLLISFVFHAVLLVVLLYFAARSGILGKQFQKLSVQLIKEPPKPKPPPPPPRVEPPKVVETPKAAPKPVEEVKAPTAAPPVTAPPAAELPSFDFDGGKAVDTSSDPVQIYRGALQFAFQSKWDRPNNLNDDAYVAEVQISVSRDGEISDPQWKKGSGNTAWDESVQKAINAVKNMDRPPPTNFPPRVTIRFDVQEQSDDVLQ
jgi:TonB C terminal